MSISMKYRWLGIATFAFLAGATACVLNGPTTVYANGSVSQTIKAAKGAEVHVTLQVIGPGIYDSVPSVSSSNVKFLDESEVFPAVPAGPTQLFRFKAVELGTAIVTFIDRPQGLTVEDTIVVN